MAPRFAFTFTLLIALPPITACSNQSEHAATNKAPALLVRVEPQDLIDSNSNKPTDSDAQLRTDDEDLTLDGSNKVEDDRKLPQRDIPAEATVLVQHMEKGKFKFEELSRKENGPLFVHLAKHSEDPGVLIGALDGMARTYRADKESEKKNLADNDYDAAVLRCLDSNDEGVLAAAMAAAKYALLDSPNEDVIRRICNVGSNHDCGGARVQALNILFLVRNYAANPRILDVFVKALADEPCVASTSLFHASYGWTQSDKAPEIKSSIEKLLGHTDAGVRGRAIETLGEFYKSDSEFIITKATPLLEDSNAFVRASAIKALGAVRDPRTIHLMMPLSDDSAKCTYEIEYTNLVDQKERVYHDGSPWSRVDDAVLREISSVTYGLGDEKRFKLGDIGYKTVDEDIAREKKRLQAWYQSFQQENPPSL